ncbi:helix-turn-helix transcriptional regulator [Rhizobium sp. P38BS-XIX]|uniref:helix-turn-helix domain-containing protein n=1 Tax=Rhizobium sp. P38BS-XIX TaxID=2726740 RepID=UPI0014572EAD|nr:AraC family transcriptional regulator [Rhizobium sp. P38BS-XIX]NLR97607.1 helix-turn-helix transcriptional regulator [Rhizobium sp. P38BS-XIX]
MLFIPLPFVVAILLLVLFVVVARESDQAAVEEAPRNGPFLALILMSAFQSVLGGLRWGYGVDEVIYIAPVGAAIIPPLAYLGVRKLTRKPAPISRPLALHALPAISIALLVVSWRSAIDIFLPMIFIGYAAAILLLMRSGPDALRATSFETAPRVFRALVFTAMALLLSAALDIFVALDFVWTAGKHAVLMITAGNLAALIILSIAGAVASRGRSFPEAADPPPQVETAEDKDTMTALQSLFETKRLYRDPDLNLDRLARKAAIPSRQISMAINRTTAKNVSQYVNEFRVAEACELLRKTARPVTEIMFEVGFQTKSNFNREFRRVTDMSPLQWRERKERPA